MYARVEIQHAVGASTVALGGHARQRTRKAAGAALSPTSAAGTIEAHLAHLIAGA